MANSPTKFAYGSASAHYQSRAAPVLSRFWKLQTKENATEAALALWECSDWLFREAHPGVDPRKHQQLYAGFRASLFAACPEFELARDFAEYTKHGGELDRQAQVVGLSGGGESGGLTTVSDEFGMREVRSPSTLELELRDGSLVSVEKVLRAVQQFVATKLA